MPDQSARTILAFDFGLKRVGVAVGEPALGTAHPLPGIVASGDALFAAVTLLLEEWHPAALVVGLPLGDQGEAHALTRSAQRFARQLEGRFRLPVTLVDERYTSVEAESRVRAAAGARTAARASRARSLDSHAAQLILEQYLGEKPA
ncbi:MAG: Holliday junction resolvase RuvX [Betaproteobacteria bacterium]|nr:Holliday junction resolvase RuvX [Betaproteobacteria bacterium]